MADVFRATDLNLQRQVAIKILREELISDPTFQASFLQEARAAANLSHPNIVTIHDFGHEGRRYFIVMEYVHGTDLKTMIRRQGPLPVDHALDLVTQACAGVGYAHRAGLIHCDLKPHNILVSPDGGAKITDFGIARALASIHPQEHQEVVWGSPQYFAPEQAAGHAPSPASDVYSLGVVLFETLTGRLPFEAANPDDLAEQHQYEPPPSPRAFNPDIPPALEMILLKVLSKEPSARYRTADQFGRVLRSFNPAQASRVPASAPIDGPRPPAQADLPTMAQVPVLGDVDWLAVLLGLIAFLALGGLIPLWLWACLQYPSCPLPAW
jgi:serine/threonine-protein kinase